MRIKGMNGEFAFKCLYKVGETWCLSSSYYFSREEVDEQLKTVARYVRWPVEVYEDGSVYIPDEGEYK